MSLIEIVCAMLVEPTRSSSQRSAHTLPELVLERRLATNDDKPNHT